MNLTKSLLVASLLDPRYKLFFLKYCLMKVYEEEVVIAKQMLLLLGLKRIILITRACCKGVHRVMLLHRPKWVVQQVHFLCYLENASWGWNLQCLGIKEGLIDQEDQKLILT